MTVTDPPVQPFQRGPFADLAPFRPAGPATTRTAVVSPMLANVLESLCEGKSNKEIGTDWGICEDTVKTHLRRLFPKLGARDRLHAVILVLSGAVDVRIKPQHGRWAATEQAAGSVDAATLGPAAPYPPPL